MMVIMSGFFEDYDDTADDVSAADYKFFNERLRTWFSTIDSNIVVSPIVKQLESLADFDSWYVKQLTTVQGMIGSGKLEWSTDRAVSLGLHLSLLRAISVDKVNFVDFATNFLGSDNHYDNMVSDINDQIFRVAARELRKRILRADQEPQVEQIPAADRIVSRSDNSEKFDVAVKSADSVIDALNANNSYPDIEEKRRLIAEIASGRELLKARQIRVSAIKATIWTALAFLSLSAVDSIVDESVSIAIKSLADLFGFTIS